MKLKDNLYRIVSKEIMEDKQAFVIVLNPSCCIYAAHFPNMPITPGVCIIRIVEELLEELTGHSLCLCTIKNAKFLSVLKPDGQDINVIYSSVKEDNGFVHTQAIISDLNSNVYAKISMQAITA